VRRRLFAHSPRNSSHRRRREIGETGYHERPGERPDDAVRGGRLWFFCHDRATIGKAANLMLLTGSRASFEIEGERPPRIRLEVMGRVEFHFFRSKMT
jgi:hypothetical protein